MVETFEPPDWLIDGVLQRRFIYSMTGQTGHAKTAVALLLAELISSTSLNNPALAKHSVSKGNVLYLVGENPDDVTMRIIGSDSLRSDDPLNDRIWFLRGVFDIGKSFDTLAAVAMEIRGIDLLIIDTSAAYFPGEEENSNTEIGEYARTLRALTTLPGEPTVLVLCHPPKFTTDLEHMVPRGGGAFLNEMDGNLTLRKITDGLNPMVELHHTTKFRGPGFEPINFRLDKITCPKLVDKTGKLIPTVHAVAISDAEIEVQQDRSLADEDHALTILLADPGVSIATIADRCGWRFATGEPAKSRAQKALERLGTAKLVKKARNGSYVLTEAGKTEARKAALRFDNPS
jgi:hypothetical protein